MFLYDESPSTLRFGRLSLKGSLIVELLFFSHTYVKGWGQKQISMPFIHPVLRGWFTCWLCNFNYFTDGVEGLMSTPGVANESREGLPFWHTPKSCFQLNRIQNICKRMSKRDLCKAKLIGPLRCTTVKLSVTVDMR